MTTTNANRPYMTAAAEWGRFHMISLPIVFIGVSFGGVGGYFYQTPRGGSSQFFAAGPFVSPERGFSEYTGGIRGSPRRGPPTPGGRAMPEITVHGCNVHFQDTVRSSPRTIVF